MEHSASSQEANDKWDNKFDQDESNVIINTETRVKPISQRSKPCGLDNLKRMCEIPVT